MKKIAFLIPSLAQAGSEKSFLYFVNAICENEVDVSIIVFSNMLQYEGQFDKKVKFYKLNGKTSNPFFLLKIKHLLSKIEPDIVFGWSTYANLCAIVLRPAKLKPKVIVSERVYLPTGLRLERNKLAYLRFRFVISLVKKFYKRADMITCNSLVNLKFMRLFIGTGPQYKLLPNSIDIASLDRKKEAFVVSDNDTDVLKLLAVGRLDKQKGFDILLKAVSLIKDKIAFKLLMVGDGNEISSLKNLCNELQLKNFVCFEGFKENPFPYYKWADIFILSSRFEGFPNVLVEAMACGKACIASDCKTGPDEITENGNIGLLYAVEDYKMLAEKILILEQDCILRENLGRKSMEKIIREYDYKRLKQIYQAIIN